MGAKVLILGGGSGGLVAANKLAKALRREGDHEITLVDRSPYHYFMPSFPWVALGFKEPEEVRRPLKNLEKKGIKFVQGEVKELLLDDKRVRVDDRELPYDFLIVSLGAEVTPDLMPGFEVAHHPWTIEAALRMREAIKAFQGGRIVIGVSGPYYRCPPAPYEVAGQIDFALQARQLRDKTEIVVAHIHPKPLSAMGPAISNVISEILESKGVKFEGSFNPKEIDPQRKVLRSDDGREIPFDLLIMVPPHKPSAAARCPGLMTPGGFPIVDTKTFRCLKHPEVFAIGDMVNPGINLPTAGVVAHFQAEFVANEIVAEIKGAYIGESFTPVAMCIMDFGDDAVLLMCDFTRILTLEGPPSCGVLGRGKAIRLTKMLFEKMWFSTYLS